MDWREGSQFYDLLHYLLNRQLCDTDMVQSQQSPDS